MGKLDSHQQSNLPQPPSEPSGAFCRGCPAPGINRISRHLSLRCFLVLLLSLAVFLSAAFWILPLSHRIPRFDAADSLKLGAAVKACFRLQKHVSELIPHIRRLEYDIYGEIGAPGTKVAVLSMHQVGSSNYTDVVFGVLSDPLDVPINEVSLIMLKSSFVELFAELANLTLTTSIFGQTSEFQILKFPGGVSIFPKQAASLGKLPQALFDFSLNNSISEIEENSVHFQEQLKSGLRLKPYENVYVLITNAEGSTLAPSVTVHASLMSDFGSLLPDRLREVADILRGPHDNLGLDKSEFGKVKSVILSSYLSNTVDAASPGPSPTPSPAPSYQLDPPSTAPSSHLPAPSPSSGHTPPCLNCEVSSPSPSVELGNPVPSVSPVGPLHPPQAHRSSGPSFAPRPSPHRPKQAVSPMFAPRASAPTSPAQNSGIPEDSLSPSQGPTSLADRVLHKEIWLVFSALLVQLLWHLQ